MVIGFGMDPMIDNQREFVTMLVTSGVHVDARFDDVRFHNIDLVDPRKAAALLNIVKYFLFSILLISVNLHLILSNL